MNYFVLRNTLGVYWEDLSPPSLKVLWNKTSEKLLQKPNSSINILLLLHWSKVIVFLFIDFFIWIQITKQKPLKMVDTDTTVWWKLGHYKNHVAPFTNMD